MATINWKTPQDVEVLFRPTAEEQREIMLKLEEEKKKREEKAGGRRGFDSVAWDGVFQPSEGARGDKNGDSGLNGQFSVQYDVDRKADAGQVVVSMGRRAKFCF